MARGDAKVDPRPIISGHYRSLVNASTGRQRWQDHVWLEGIPIVVAVGVYVGDVRLPASASAGLLTVAGLLGAFLFSLMVSVADRAATWADTAPPPGRRTSEEADYLAELAANAGYAALVSVTTSVVFVVAATTERYALRIATAVGLGAGAHLVPSWS